MYLEIGEEMSILNNLLNRIQEGISSKLVHPSEVTTTTNYEFVNEQDLDQFSDAQYSESNILHTDPKLNLDEAYDMEFAHKIEKNMVGFDPLIIPAMNSVFNYSLHEVSISVLQKILKIGYSRSLQLIGQLEKWKFVGRQDGSNYRKILVSEYDWVKFRAYIYYFLNATPNSNLNNQFDISNIDHMDGHKFEYFCADLLKNNGFVNVSVTPGSGDMGVDILAEKEGVKYAIQCKNYESSLGNKPIQEITAGKNYYNCHVGVVMTNSHFTPGAIELAKANNILLWDRSYVQKMMSSQK